METYFDRCPTEKYMWCLNRTMQYGNNGRQKKDGERYGRLNRTMQYGNFFETMKIITRNHCLNRTMQYGNYEKKEKKEKKMSTFKSYYVVWKLFS